MIQYKIAFETLTRSHGLDWLTRFGLAALMLGATCLFGFSQETEPAKPPAKPRAQTVEEAQNAAWEFRPYHVNGHVPFMVNSSIRWLNTELPPSLSMSTSINQDQNRMRKFLPTPLNVRSAPYCSSTLPERGSQSRTVRAKSEAVSGLKNWFRRYLYLLKQQKVGGRFLYPSSKLRFMSCGFV